MKPAVDKKSDKVVPAIQPDKKVGSKAPVSKPDPTKVAEKPMKQVAIGKIGNPVADAEQRKIKQAIAAEK